MLVINRLLLLVLGIVYVFIAAAGAVKGKPALPLFHIGLVAAAAIAYSTLQGLPLWLQRLLGVVTNGVLLLAVLYALLLSWRAEGPSLLVPLLALVVILLLGVPLVQLALGTAPPTIWKRRA
jgi:hypothetical protein